jgi:uncharacterized protein involved in exopolysaccharide biosynthesis
MITASDQGAEREIDLARLGRSLSARWWIVAAGVVAGAVIGALLALSSGSVYRASALIAPGQPIGPGGQPVLTYQASPRTIAEIVTSEAALKDAAAVAGMSVGELRGHIRTDTVETGVGSANSRAAVLIRITVELHKRKRAEQAANALAAIVKRDTTSIYVRQSIATYKTKIASYTSQLAALENLITNLSSVVSEQSLDPLNKLVLVSQLDNAVQRQGNLNDKLTTTQAQLTLAQNIEIAQTVEPAVAQKTTARSRRNSVLVGALLGLILGAIAAIVVDTRASRTHRA